MWSTICWNMKILFVMSICVTIYVQMQNKPSRLISNKSIHMLLNIA